MPRTRGSSHALTPSPNAVLDGFTQGRLSPSTASTTVFISRAWGAGAQGRFNKPKYPFVWFDAPHVLEATSPLPSAWKDERFLELLAGVVKEADAAGRYTPESVWMEWKAQCFGRKDAPSPWLSLVVHRILARDPRRDTKRPQRRGAVK